MIDALVFKIVKAYGVTGSAGLFAIAGFGAGFWLVAAAWRSVNGESELNETKVRLYEAELKRLKLTYAFAVMLTTVGFCVVAVLGDINKSIQEVSQAIRLQTAQQSWLVEHYAKPVRHILPWKEDK